MRRAVGENDCGRVVDSRNTSMMATTPCAGLRSIEQARNRAPGSVLKCAPGAEAQNPSPARPSIGRRTQMRGGRTQCQNARDKALPNNGDRGHHRDRDQTQGQ